MILPSYDGSEVEITLSGKRWPYMERGHQIWEWLKVSIRVLTPLGSIQFRWECLLHWEAEDLIRWLEAITQDESVDPSIRFYEGILSLEVLSSHDKEVTLRCHLRASADRWTLAEGVNRQNFRREHSYWQEIDLMMSWNQLAKSAHELRQEFERLPMGHPR
jgi:hypothetical protein